MKRKRTAASTDPLRNACKACGADIGEGCKTITTPDNRRTYASRLVHADRLESAGGEIG